MPHKPEGEIYNCGHHALCQVPSSIMYAWAKDAPPTALPPDVGFQLDEEEDGYIVMQVRTYDRASGCPIWGWFG